MIGLFVGLAAAGEPALAEGRYRLTLHSASRAKVPVLGWTPSVTTSVLLVELSRAGDGWVQAHQVCDVRMSGPDGRSRTTIPDAFVAALPDKRYPVALRPDEGALRYVADLGVDHVGYDPALTDELPEDAEDVGVIDADGDGMPGVTVQVTAPVAGSADVYVVQRGSMRLVGEVADDGTVSGRIEVDVLEQRTLGASKWMFGGSPEIRPVPEDSWFTMAPTSDTRCDRGAGESP